MADDAYKKLSFKDFLNVDYKPGEDELIKRNAKKRKMDTPTGNTGESYVPEAKEEVEVLESFVSEAESIDEVLSYSARRKKARSLRKNKAKVQMGARKARRRMADRGRLKNRAQKQARNSMFLKLSKGVPRSDMPPARRAQIEKRLAMMGKRIERIAKRTLPKVRKMEIERKRSAKK
jgi:hypothetical protein